MKPQHVMQWFVKKISVALCMMSIVVLAQASTPSEFVQNNSQKVIDIIQWHNGKNGAQIRQQIEVAVIPWFDFDRITALAVGQHWKKATPTQQTQLVTAFQQLLLNTYTSMVIGFKNAKIIIKQKPRLFENSSTSVAMVNVQVRLPQGTRSRKISVKYALYKSEADWKIFNVSVEGMSLVTMYRHQFNSKVARNGISGLIHFLQEKNRQTHS
ncbi:MAG: ABC transporter substrate-binding protein [Neisseriales bacterium]|nr:MAG: ABC transporter substrate-binding protein [Neisseriales bacterium]